MPFACVGWCSFNGWCDRSHPFDDSREDNVFLHAAGEVDRCWCSGFNKPGKITLKGNVQRAQRCSPVHASERSAGHNAGRKIHFTCRWRCSWCGRTALTRMGCRSSWGAEQAPSSTRSGGWRSTEKAGGRSSTDWRGHTKHAEGRRCCWHVLLRW